MNCLICHHADANHRYACNDCTNRMRRQLREIVGYAGMLRTTTMLMPSRGNTGRRSPGYASTSPARDDIIVLTDRRSTVDEEDPGTWPILGTLYGLVRYVAGQLDEVLLPSMRVWPATQYLLSKIDRMAMEQWIGSVAADVTDLHAKVRAAARDQPPGSLGQCLSVGCGGQVHWLYKHLQPGVEARCLACSRPYTGLALARLSTQEAS